MGFGIYELANIGLRYQIDQMQIGASIGTSLKEFGEANSILGDIRFHFGEQSKPLSRKPWYFRVGFAFFKDKSGEPNKFLYLNTRIGRESKNRNALRPEGGITMPYIDRGEIQKLLEDPVALQ